MMRTWLAYRPDNQKKQPNIRGEHCLLFERFVYDGARLVGVVSEKRCLMRAESLSSPAERRRLKVRELILSAAERVFANEGADGLSIRRLAQKIDYSPAAIYKYFGSKDELVDELKEAFFAKILTRVNDIADKSCPFPERVRECVATYVRIAIEKPHHYAAAFIGRRQEETPDADITELAETNKGQAFAVLEAIVQEGIDDGHFRAELDATLSAKSIWVSMHGLAMMMIHLPNFPAISCDDETLSSYQFIEFHADMVVRGLE